MQIKLIEYMSEPQRRFFQAQTRFVGYGGARGGGKSWSVRKKAVMMAVRYPGIKILILRRTFPELRENHILPLRADLQGIAQYRESDKAFTFPGGSRVRFGYCDGETDVLQYQGQEYDVIFMDEATQFTEYQFTTLTACLRGANSFPKRSYLTCNPGGVGHTWVKRLFIDRVYRDGEDPKEYTFIRASVRDNKPLIDNDPGYLHMLEALPDNLRKAWLDGDWDIFAGQYFTMWDRDVHVVRPFLLPGYWQRYVSLDYGRDMLACYWIAVDERGRSVVYKELYKSNLTASQAAREIKEMTGREAITAYYAPPDLWNKHSDSGRSTAEIFAAEQEIYLVRASNDRVQGWYDLAEWLQPVEDEQGQKTARLRIFENCQNLIRTLPALQYDSHNPNDTAREPHELTHAPDALRYFVAGRPLPAAVPVEPEEDRAEYEDQVNDFLEYGV